MVASTRSQSPAVCGFQVRCNIRGLGCLCLGRRLSSIRPGGRRWLGTGHCSLSSILSWDDAQALCGVALQDERQGLPSSHGSRVGIRSTRWLVTAYFWGDEIGKANANCDGCESKWDKRASPVGSFEPNAFGLYDMAGNVWQWVEDCYHENYNGAPADGSAWTLGECKSRVLRGGSWGFKPDFLRSTFRMWSTPNLRNSNVGFRVGRTLGP